MLPHTVVMMCTFEVGMVQLLAELLFPLLMELDLLIYMEFDGNQCIGWCLSFSELKKCMVKR